MKQKDGILQLLTIVVLASLTVKLLKETLEFSVEKPPSAS